MQLNTIWRKFSIMQLNTFYFMYLFHLFYMLVCHHLHVSWEKRENYLKPYFPLISKQLPNTVQPFVRFEKCPFSFSAISKIRFMCINQVIHIAGATVDNLDSYTPFSIVTIIIEVDSAINLSLIKSGMSSRKPPSGWCSTGVIVNWKVNQLLKVHLVLQIREALV